MKSEEGVGQEVHSLLVKHKFTRTLGKSSGRLLRLKSELLYNTATLPLGVHQDHDDEERTVSLTSNVGKTVVLCAKELVSLTCPLGLEQLRQPACYITVRSKVSTHVTS